MCKNRPIDPRVEEILYSEDEDLFKDYETANDIIYESAMEP